MGLGGVLATEGRGRGAGGDERLVAVGSEGEAVGRGAAAQGAGAER